MILEASFNLSPVAAVNFYLSLPAKSTKFNLLFLVYIPFVLYSNYNVNIEWLRELSKFIYVADTCLLANPLYIKDKTSLKDPAAISVKFSTYTLFESSLIVKGIGLASFKRSINYSL